MYFFLQNCNLLLKKSTLVNQTIFNENIAKQLIETMKINKTLEELDLSGI